MQFAREGKDGSTDFSVIRYELAQPILQAK